MSRLVLATACAALFGCAGAMKVAGFPPAPRRTTPPPGLSDKALPVGAKVPSVTLSGPGGLAWSSITAPRDGRTVLVFFRGHW